MGSHTIHRRVKKWRDDVQRSIDSTPFGNPVIPHLTDVRITLDGVLGIITDEMELDAERDFTRPIFSDAPRSG